MNDVTEFFMAMEPPTVTAQEHKVSMRRGKPHFYDPPEVEDAKAKLTAHLAGYVPEKRYEHGVRLINKWIYPCGDTHADGEWKVTRPDTDNSLKALKDCMTRCGFWRDDCLIASEVTEKMWGKVCGIYIRIEPLEVVG